MSSYEDEFDDEMADLLAEIETLQHALAICNDKACALLKKNERLREALERIRTHYPDGVFIEDISDALLECQAWAYEALKEGRDE